MTNSYFKQVPNFEYVNRTKGSTDISNYISVKNLFKRGRIRPDIFGNLSYFTKYKIIGDDRPDNIAFKEYEDASLDWVVLLSNNILNVQDEWPLPQSSLDEILLDKYGSYEALNNTHHYETQEIKNSKDVVIVPKGLQCASDYTVTYYDYNIDQEKIVLSKDCTTAVTNYEYESEIEDNKRNIFLLKPRYISVIRNDIDASMPYKKGSTQYVSETLKRADNIRLYQ